MLRDRAAACFAILALAACHGQPDGARVAMDVSRAGGFWTAPFPSDDLLASGTVDLSAFPNPRGNDLVRRVLALLAGQRGFALAGGVFFHLSAPLDPARLPDVAGTLAAGAPVFLVGIDPGSPDYLKATPLEVSFETDGGPFGASNLLALVPVQGFPLRPRSRYAAVVRRSLRDSQNRSLSTAAIPNLPTYRIAAAALQALGVPLSDVAGIAAFTTGDPTADLATVRADALMQTRPAPLTPFALAATYPGYCLYRTTARVPVYQRGAPPYTQSGGGWTFDANGKPVLQRFEEANLFVSVPRAPMPAAGWPAVVYIRAGGVGEVPMADRGTQPADGAGAAPGSGPAMHFAAVGFAGVQIDGPLGGRRNLTGGDEQFLIFNVTNPEALRDNVRQTAIELSALAQSIDNFVIDSSGCPGSSPGAKVDAANLALWGHSTGASIAPLALANEPRFRAGILSGAGGSWIENVMQKQKPLAVKPVAELLLGYGESGRSLSNHDPVLTLVQWAAEPADTQVYARRVLREPDMGAPVRHVLMFQGIVDHYILPRIANTLSASLGLDLGGPALDATVAELASTTHALDVLPLAGRGQLVLPVRANLGGQTGVLVQHLADGIEDGHEVAFQTEAPKHQYRCFLFTLLHGAPRVLPDAPADAPCE